MRQILTNFDVSGTSDTSTIYIPRVGIWIMWLWKVEFASGSGTNQVTITARTIANPEADAATEELFDLTNTEQWKGPRVVTDTMVTAAPSSALRLSSSMRLKASDLRLNFVRSGGGSRVFRFNVWANTD